jgi:hypothetical protein
MTSSPFPIKRWPKTECLSRRRIACVWKFLGHITRPFEPADSRLPRQLSRASIRPPKRESLPREADGLVAQLVEQCPFNSNRPILAIFSPFLFSLETIANTLISLVFIHF